MQIGLDLRFLKNNYYSKFVTELVKGLISQDKENKYIIYSNSILEGFDYDNVIISNVWIRNNTIKEQTSFLKILKNDDNNIVIFFNHYKPILYKGIHYTFIPSLKEVFYNDFKNYIDKYTYLFLLESSLNKSKKIICFDENTQNELTERFNIDYKKINTIDAFFPQLKEENNLKIDIRNKYDIKNNYFIYHDGDGIEKNYEKLIKVFSRLDNKNIDLIFLGNNISKNMYLKDLIKKASLENNIRFFPILKEGELELFYKNSQGVIMPSFYTPFPLRLSNAINFNSTIISSDLKSVKKVFGDSIKYFSPISVNSIYNTILESIKTKNTKNNYNKILSKYNKENTIKQLLNIIK